HGAGRGSEGEGRVAGEARCPRAAPRGERPGEFQRSAVARGRDPRHDGGARVTHPRLSVSEMCTYPLPFAEELGLWDELDVHRVGVITAKLDQHGRDAAVADLKERSIVATTLITSMFELGAPETWDANRATMNEAIDLAAVIGGCTYFTPGRRDGRTFDELTASLAEAVAPCAAPAASRGVRLAIEPS